MRKIKSRSGLGNQKLAAVRPLVDAMREACLLPQSAVSLSP